MYVRRYVCTYVGMYVCMYSVCRYVTDVVKSLVNMCTMHWY